MTKPYITSSPDGPAWNLDSVRTAARESIYPLVFSAERAPGDAGVYLRDPPTRRLVEFFERKGLGAIKEEDRREQWYEDWLAYQAEHGLYAAVLSPKAYSTSGAEFDPLRYARFLEVFAYFSPAHGYSLQVTFLGLFAVLMGSNPALKREAVAALEAGGLLAFGVSEKGHGSDLFGNEFTVREVGPGRLVANGTKYYIGNSNCASVIAILGRKEARRGNRDEGPAGRGAAADSRSSGNNKRAPFVLFALRPKDSKGFRNGRKIRTLGVRAGFVGEFAVEDHELAEGDLIGEGRVAWDAVFGTVTLGKFFLGFGSVGICEHALAEATAHLGGRVLYGKPAIEMPHLRSATAAAYARLTAMKLYAYRALDYVRAASEADRRYLLFNAVQKAKVSTEGVKVMALLSECVGAKGFESDTYFEMALRDAQLIPGLEGSTHVNLALAARFIPRYFAKPDRGLAAPPSQAAGETPSGENPYLMEARTGALNTIAFPHFLTAYGPLRSVPNVRLFARQAKALRLFVWRMSKRSPAADAATVIALGQCLATIAYAQLVAENAVRLAVPPQMVSAIFHLLVGDLSALALTVASFPGLDLVSRVLIRRVVTVPRTTTAEWEFVAGRVDGLGKTSDAPTRGAES